MARANYKKYLGVGLYTVSEAARFVGAPYPKVKRWLGDSRGYEPVVHHDSPMENTVTFKQLMELMFVRLFRDQGVSLQTIRKASKAAAKRFRTDHPFAVQRFDTDGRSIFATLKAQENDERIIEDLAHGQLVFEQIITPFFRKIEYDKDAIRYWPLEPTGRIVLDPERRFGQPIDNETGVPTATILAALKAGGGQEKSEVADWLDIPLEAVQAAISFDHSLAS